MVNIVSSYLNNRHTDVSLLHATHGLPWEMQRWKCEWVEAAVICGMWWMTGNGVGGGHPRACRDSHPDPCNDQESGRKREKGRQIKRERWPNVEEGKKGREQKGKKRGSTCFNFSRQWSEGHGRRGRWVSEWEWSIIYLSSIFLTLIPLFFSPPFPSFHASVLLFLASRGSVAKANKQRRLFISASGE